LPRCAGSARVISSALFADDDSYAPASLTCKFKESAGCLRFKYRATSGVSPSHLKANYHDTDSFGRDDLPLLAKLAGLAHTFIFEFPAELKTEQSE